jgi:hypothetical protein
MVKLLSDLRLMSFAAIRWTATFEQHLNIPLSKDLMKARSITHLRRRRRSFDSLPISVSMRNRHTLRHQPTGQSPN